MNKGRPPKGQGDFPFDVFSEYQTDNIKEDPVIEDIKPENVEFSHEENTENPDVEKKEDIKEDISVDGNENASFDGNQAFSTDDTEKVYISLTEKDLILFDAVISGFLETIFHTIGINKDFPVISNEEARILKRVMPEIQVEKSWKNFFIVYLSIKIIK